MTEAALNQLAKHHKRSLRFLCVHAVWHGISLVPLHANRFLIGRTRVFKVVESGQRDAEVHVRRWEIRFEIDGSGEVVKGGGILVGVEMHEAEVVRNDPFERIQIQGTLQARNRGNVTLLAKETHA